MRFRFTLLTYQSIGVEWQSVCCSSLVIPFLNQVVLNSSVRAVVDQHSSRFSVGWRWRQRVRCRVREITREVEWRQLVSVGHFFLLRGVGWQHVCRSLPFLTAISRLALSGTVRIAIHGSLLCLLVDVGRQCLCYFVTYILASRGSRTWVWSRQWCL